MGQMTLVFRRSFAGSLSVEKRKYPKEYLDQLVMVQGEEGVGLGLIRLDLVVEKRPGRDGAGDLLGMGGRRDHRREENGRCQDYQKNF